MCICCRDKNRSIIHTGNRDKHGCLPSAGYTWCDSKQKCIRPWEESCKDIGETINKLKNGENVGINYNGAREGSIHRKEYIIKQNTESNN